MVKRIKNFLILGVLVFFSSSLVYGSESLLKSDNNSKNPDYTVYAFNAWDPTGALADGLVSFTLNNPGEITYINSLPNNEMIASFAFVDDVLVGFEHGTNKLYTVDVETGSFDLSSVLDISPNSTLTYQ